MEVPLAPPDSVQKSRYVWTHRLKSETRLKAFSLLELQFRGRVNECEQTISTPLYLFT